MFKARPAQEEILRYTGGYMGIKAVPGSGKTHTLSYLASLIIRSNVLQDDQEILVVTLVNSAVENFSRRISAFIQEAGLLPNTGYRVRTLHGLAHDIIRERPDLAGLSDQFQIVDERETYIILSNIVTTWIHANQHVIDLYASADENQVNTRNFRNWEQLLISMASSFIRLSKDYQHSSNDIQEKLEKLNLDQALLHFGSDIYREYQNALHYRGAIDYDDLIWLALRAMESDQDYLHRLQHRWPYILEDEAQDSSRLQEKALRLLAGRDGNWVRVGDPNQAIFETFTTAHPSYLLNFIKSENVAEESLPNSGRSTQSIISLANHLIKWSQSSQNPNPDMHGTLSTPLIHPTPPDDPQPNPPDQPDKIYLHPDKLTPEREIELIAKSIASWLPENPDKTAAVLVARNDRGAKIVDALNALRIQPVELLRSSASTRQTADILSVILKHLSEPTAVRHLADLYSKLIQIETYASGNDKLAERIVRYLRSHSQPEQLIWPDDEQEWLLDIKERDDADMLHELEWFCTLVRKWHQAAILSIDQLILTLSQDLFSLPIDLALAHKIALSMEISADNHPDWLLPNFSEELQQIAENRRKFYGFANEDIGFNPDEHKGKVVVTTMHKAKGLEWDRVYLVSINNYDFPYGDPEDNYIGEKWYVKDKMNLEEETLARLKALLEDDMISLHMEEGEATRLARIEYARERLRLFFVGVTRAKSELVITWNSGRNGNNHPSVPFQELMRYWKYYDVNT